MEAVNFFNISLVNAASWFVSLLDSVGMVEFYLSMFFISLVGRFILLPLFGAARSDAVKEIRNWDKPPKKHP